MGRPTPATHINLFAANDRKHRLDRICDPLAILDKQVDYAAIAERVHALLPAGDRSRVGRPSYSEKGD